MRPRRVDAAALAALAMLCGLGAWQLHRRAWKAEILAAIDRAEAAPPVPLLGEAPPFARVVARGRFLPAVAFYGAKVMPSAAGVPRMGADLIQLLEPDDGKPVVVDRGFVTLPYAGTPASGPAEVVGYLRPAEHPGLFSAGDEPGRRRYFTLDPVTLGAALGGAVPAPFTLVALGKGGGAEPVPAVALPRPPNDHLSYALTWFGLAVSLVAVYLPWRRKQG